MKLFLLCIFEKSVILAKYVLLRCHGIEILFEICSRHLFLLFLRRLKEVTKKTSFLRCLWDVLKTSQKSCPFWLFVWLCTWFRVIWVLFPQIALMPKYHKNRYNSIIRWSWQKSKTSFDVKCGAGDYGLI